VFLALEELPSATVSVLADNLCGDDDVLGEWGLSLLLCAGAQRILLDTGAGHVLRGNARALKVDLSDIDALVLSHGHYDHTGGIGALLPSRDRLRVFVHPSAFATSYWKRRGTVETWRMTPARAELAAQVRDIVDTTMPTFVTPAVLVTGEIPRETDFEDTGLTKEAFLDEAMAIPDPIVDDQAVVFRVPQGVVVLLGCGHSGLVNTLQRVRALLGVDRIHAVMGGSHLIAASPARLERTIAELEAVGIERLLLSHCTGTEAFARLAQAFPGKCSWPRAGTVVTFGTPSSWVDGGQG
jgi:7,8-dihydropterin-6-yl-methyl-4-(beta-D-ribofuranosyl)aminobenzene 5'-phosphate synthase